MFIEYPVFPSTPRDHVIATSSLTYLKQVAIMRILHQEGQHSIKIHMNYDGCISTHPTEGTEEGKLEGNSIATDNKKLYSSYVSKSLSEYPRETTLCLR